MSPLPTRVALDATAAAAACAPSSPLAVQVPPSFGTNIPRAQAYCGALLERMESEAAGYPRPTVWELAA